MAMSEGISEMLQWVKNHGINHRLYECSNGDVIAIYTSSWNRVFSIVKECNSTVTIINHKVSFNDVSVTPNKAKTILLDAIRKGNIGGIIYDE